MQYFHHNFGEGPKWNKNKADCSHIIDNLLFITVYTEKIECTGWTWYLDCDIQLFFFGLLGLMYYKKKNSKLLIYLLLIVG